MKRSFYHLPLFVIIWSCNTHSFCEAQPTQSPSTSALTSSTQQKFARLEKQRDWTRADLTENNVAFAKIRRDMEAQFKQGIKPTTLAQKYQLRGNDRYDMRKVFQWAHAAFWAQAKEPDQNKLIEINEAMDFNLKPGAYDWVRLRFLVQASQIFRQPEQLILVGRRLLLRQPKDAEVRYGLALMLVGGEEKDLLNALSMVKEQIRTNPKSLRWAWQLPQTYAALWEQTGERQYNQAAVAAYKHTLTILPDSDRRRKIAVRMAVTLGLYYDGQGRRQKITPAMLDAALKSTTLR